MTLRHLLKKNFDENRTTTDRLRLASVEYPVRRRVMRASTHDQNHSINQPFIVIFNFTGRE